MQLPISSGTIHQTVPFVTLLERRRCLMKPPYIYFLVVELVKIL